MSDVEWRCTVCDETGFYSEIRRCPSGIDQCPMCRSEVEEVCTETCHRCGHTIVFTEDDVCETFVPHVGDTEYVECPECEENIAI